MVMISCAVAKTDIFAMKPSSILQCIVYGLLMIII